MPRVSLAYQRPAYAQYNVSKVALLIENRPYAFLAPLMLHFISVVPPDWRFRFMGSEESVASINQSVAIRHQVDIGKLDLTYIPPNMSVASTEYISRFLTNLWLYETVLQPAEWLLVFQSDSILCANSRQNIDDYLEYDWVGAPWNPSGRFGGNGGLSLRRVSPIVEILREQVRVDGGAPEDVWLTDRLGDRLGAKMANGSVSLQFSGEMNQGVSEAIVKEGSGSEILAAYNNTLAAAAAGEWVEGIDDWRDGHYEPLGYHMGASGTNMHAGIWGTPEKRKHIWKYCPEVKMTLGMDAAKYIPGDCRPNWKRDEGGDGEGEGDNGRGALDSRDFGYGTEVIDGVEYPMLPPNLMPW